MMNSCYAIDVPGIKKGSAVTPSPKGSSPDTPRPLRCTTMAASNPGNVYVGVVDDDESLRRSRARLLRAVGMRPVTYASAEDFRADLKKPHFDCLVLDLQLPGLSGLELRDQFAAEGTRRRCSS
jgi:PleD family two-component response regulator